MNNNPMLRFLGEENLIISYLTLRKTIGFIGILFPLVLMIGGFTLFRTGFQPTLSDYYYTGMGDLFVGTLCVVGFFLFSYRGYNETDQSEQLMPDNWLSNLGWLFALGVALLPTNPPEPSRAERIIGYIHVGFAASLFLTLIYFSLFLFTKTHPRVPPNPEKLQRNRIYRVCGYVMAVSFVLALIYYLTKRWLPSLAQFNPILWFETFMVMAFGVSWLVKGEAIPPLNDSPASQARVLEALSRIEE